MSDFRSYNEELRERFGCRVYKVSIDGGFTCPNRDGTKGYEGCVFCDERGSSSRTHSLHRPITEQIQRNIDVRRSRFGAQKFIAYFQSFTNTYAPVAVLKQRYDEAIEAHPDIVGLSISTRADCVDEEKLSLIAAYRKRVPLVCVEYGMQTVHDKTLQLINRKETHADFLRAFSLTKQFELEHCIHVILGLPNETSQDMKITAERIGEYGIRGVKIHFLVAMDKTQLAHDWNAGSWTPMTMSEAVERTCEFIELLPSDCIIHRIGGNGHPKHALAPDWVWKKKKEFREVLHAEFIRRNSRQGSFYNSNPLRMRE